MVKCKEKYTTVKDMVKCKEKYTTIKDMVKCKEKYLGFAGKDVVSLTNVAIDMFKRGFGQLFQFMFFEVSEIVYLLSCLLLTFITMIVFLAEEIGLVLFLCLMAYQLSWVI